MTCPRSIVGPRLPTFLYVGASKAGSSWIYEILREHPEVFVPAAKDLQFFDSYYQKGLDWYCGQFHNARNAKAIGEVSHDYFLAQSSAYRIAYHLPEVKIIACLREPVDKILSSYRFNRTTTVNKNITFGEYAFSSAILKQNAYFENLRPFVELLGRSRVLVLFYDDLKLNPNAFVQRIYQFIGVNDCFQPPSLHRRVLPARDARSEWLAHKVFSGARFARKLGLANLVGTIKRSQVASALLYRPPSRDLAISDDIIHRLRQTLSETYPELEQLLDCRLPKAWRETP
jgi:hypothetical protein